MAESHREEIAKLEALYANNPGGRVFVHLAEALRKAGEYERARAILGEGLGRHGDSASGYVVLGRVLSDLRLHDEAEQAFRRVLELDAANLVALRGLADLARDSGRYDTAARHYAELLSRSPFDEEIRHLLADAERASRDLESGPVAEQDDGAAPESADSDAQWAPAAGDDHTAQAPGGTAPVAPFSAAPGDTGDAVPADPEFGLVDIDVMPGDLAEFAGSSGIGPLDTDEEPFEWGAATPDPDVDELFHIPADAAVLDERIEGRFDGEPILFEEFDAGLELARSDDEEPDLAEIHERTDAGEPALEGLLGAEPGDTGYSPEWPGAAGTGMAGWPLDETEPDDAAVGSAADQHGAQPSEPREEAPAPPREQSAAEMLTAELRTWGQTPSQQERDREAGLVTETMADLYMSQGHHERAAEVYRALLERRPGDDRLLTKLNAADHARRPAAADAGADEDAGEAWLQGVGTAWAGTGTADEAAATPYSWTGGEAADQEPEATSAVPIEEYMRSLLSWRGGRAPEFPAAAAETGPPPSTAPADAAPDAPWGAGAAEDVPEEPWAGSDAPDEGKAEPWAGSDAPDERNAEPWASGEAAADPWSDAVPLEQTVGREEPWNAGDLDAWAPAAPEGAPTPESPEPPAVRGEEPPSRSGGVSPVEEAFHEWYTDSPGAAAAPGTAGAAPYAAEQQEPTGVERTPTPHAAADASSEEDDEDLAMFREWLKSLKK